MIETLRGVLPREGSIEEHQGFWLYKNKNGPPIRFFYRDDKWGCSMRIDEGALCVASHEQIEMAIAGLRMEFCNLASDCTDAMDFLETLKRGPSQLMDESAYRILRRTNSWGEDPTPYYAGDDKWSRNGIEFASLAELEVYAKGKWPDGYWPTSHHYYMVAGGNLDRAVFLDALMKSKKWIDGGVDSGDVFAKAIARAHLLDEREVK